MPEIEMDELERTYQCCPGGATIDVSALASGKDSSVMCLRCGRWFLSHAGPVGRGYGPRIAGDVYVDPDGSFHVQRKSIRDLIASLC